MQSPHHAYLIAAPRDSGVLEAKKLVGDILSDELSGNPDFFFDEYVSLGIEDARGLRERAANKPVRGERKAFIEVFDFITLEAQNALLKLLEEPSAGTHFFLVVPNADILLPTVRSRLEEVRIHGDTTARITPEAHTFLSAPLKERLQIAADIAADKDKSRAIALLDGLSVLLHARLGTIQKEMKEEAQEKSPKPPLRRALSEILDARNYLSDRSPSIKMLLEHIALTVAPK